MRNCKVLGKLCDLNLFERFLRHTLHFPTYIVYVIKFEREYKRFRAFRSGRERERETYEFSSFLGSSLSLHRKHAPFNVKSHTRSTRASKHTTMSTREGQAEKSRKKSYKNVCNAPANLFRNPRRTETSKDQHFRDTAHTRKTHRV